MRSPKKSRKEHCQNRPKKSVWSGEENANEKIPNRYEFCYLIVGEREKICHHNIMDRWMKIDHSITLLLYLLPFLFSFPSFTRMIPIDRMIYLLSLFPCGSILHLLSFFFISHGKSDLERLLVQYTQHTRHTHTPLHYY